MKNDHIEELQEALKESVTIISEREEDLFQEQIKRKDIQDQVLSYAIVVLSYTCVNSFVLSDMSIYTVSTVT